MMKEREARELAERLGYRILKDRTAGPDAWLVYDLHSGRRLRSGRHAFDDVVAWLQREEGKQS